MTTAGAGGSDGPRDQARITLRKTGSHWRRIDDSVVVLDGRSSAYFSVNSTGSSLWESLDAGAPHATLVATLAQRHGLEAAEAETDVTAFLELITELGFLKA